MMNDDNIDAIYEFGKEIVINARDSAIKGLNNILNGTAYGSCDKNIMEEIKKIPLNPHQKEMIKLLAISSMDLLLHSFFVNFEESSEKYRIIAKDNQGKDFDIVTQSDGLPYGYYVFVDEYSKYKSSNDAAIEDISDQCWSINR